MADARIRAIITAQDNATPVIKGFGKGLDETSGKVGGVTSKLRESTLALGALALGAGVAFKKMIDVIGDTTAAANRQQSALIGLSSVSKAFGQNLDKTTEAAKDLASDGLMPIADAATGLKNLLASGFSLDQAIKLMNRFKDSAAFGRQGSLDFGEAIRSATEGIKNGNSILVDNAGVTKNLSVILEEAGFSAQDLMKATTDAGVRQALFNGIIKETNAQVGDAAKYADTYGGKQAALAAKTEQLKVKIGTALQPVLTRLLESITPIIEKISAWTDKHPDLAAKILMVTVVGAGLIATMGAIATVIPIVTGVVGALVTPLAGMALGIGAVVGAATLLTMKIQSASSEGKTFSGSTMAMSAALTALVPGIGVVMGPLAMFIGNMQSANAQAQQHKVALDAVRLSQDAVKVSTDMLTNAQLGQKGAALGVEQAQNTYNETVKAYGENSLQARQAAYSLEVATNAKKEADKSAAQAQQQLTDKQNEAKAAQDRLSESTKRSTDSVNSNKNSWGELGDKISNFVKDNSGRRTLLNPLGIKIPGFASGVQNFSGGMAMVGENGPELVTLPKGANVIPNNKLATSSSTATTVNISLNVGMYAGSEIEKRKVAKELFASLQEVANQKNTTVAQMMGA